MKKTILFGAIACVICAPVYASDGVVYSDYNTEMKTVAEDYARVERVEKPVVKTVVAKPACTKCNKCSARVCGEPFERVVNREYFVRETVQQYKPVVSYVPAGSYTTMRAIESPKCNKCGF